MGNIKPYQDKTRIENAFITSFSYTDTLESLNVTGWTQGGVRCYWSGTQDKYASERGTEPFHFINYGEFSVQTALTLHNGEKINILKIPFYDSDHAVQFYILIRAVCTGSVSSHSWHGGGNTIPMFISGGISLDGENIINDDITDVSYPPIFFSWSGTMYSYTDYPSDDDNFQFASTTGKHDGHDIISLALHAQYDYNPYNPNHYSTNFSGFSVFYDLNDLTEKFGASMETFEFSDSLGEIAELPTEYGGGSFDFSSDEITIPDVPTVGVSTSGCVNVYEISSDELNGFINELFPPFNGITPGTLQPPNDVVDALVNIADCFYNFISNVFPLAEMWINKGLIDFVLDCHMIPCTPSVGGDENICVSWKTFTQTASRVTSDYIDVDCGTLNIRECFGNMADYLTHAQLFLPFIGFVPLEPEFFQNAVVGIKYRFNVIDGSFMAYIYSTTDKSKPNQTLSNSVIAQYSGSSCVHLPITATNYANIFSGLMQGSLSIATGAASGGVGGLASTAQSIGQMLEMRPELAGNNSYSASSSFLSVRKPYILIARPAYYLSKSYVQESGVPNCTRVVLGNISGYTECLNPVLDGFISLDDDEKTELKQILESGFYM